MVRIYLHAHKGEYVMEFYLSQRFYGSLNILGNAMREFCQLNAVFQRLCTRTRLERRVSDVILKKKP